MVNGIVVEGIISSDIRKVEQQGRPVCLFTLAVKDINPFAVYSFPVVAWNELAEWVMTATDEELAHGIRVTGKLTSRETKAGVRVEIVAAVIGSLMPAVAPKARLAPYPAVEPNKARRAAEKGEGMPGYNRAEADAQNAAEAEQNGVPFTA